MPEHELAITAFFNDHLASVANSILSAVRMTAENPQRPWQNWLVMEILVVLLLMVLFAVLRPRLSVDNPGPTQHIFETIWQFVKHTAEDVSVHHSSRYVAYFATVFIFILFMNLIGTIPGFESPTMTPAVPLGMALATWFYYHVMGVRELGPVKYLAHFAGPVWWLAWLIFPIEIVSHFARPLSLTFRLYGNMFAGEQVTGVFLRLTYLVLPALFMGLHVFVSFLQAYIFMLLTMIYVGGATSHEH
jgi:F-type H+-transporting ATPase subunit a